MRSHARTLRTRTSRLGDLLAQSGSHAQALSYYRKAMTELEKLGAESSEDPYARFRVILVRGGIGEMQAHLGERSAALSEYARAIKLLDGIAADPTSGMHSSLRGQAYMRVAAIQAALGAAAEPGQSEQQEHWRTARELYARSLGTWQDMQARGILTAEDRTKPQEVAREIARCDAVLDGAGSHLSNLFPQTE